MSNDDWVPTDDHSLRRGGQGAVVQVRHTRTNVLGAKKSLLPVHLRSQERRARMVREVMSLRELSGLGTPRVLDENSEAWKQAGEPLYVVMEWIDGKTLSERCNGKLLSLDAAMSIVCPLLETLCAVHDKGIVHRDIKPDNVILRGDAENLPCLVDFGMSWTEVEDSLLFETEIGQELGNRFLRLPEHAPGQHVRDPRSDVTMVAGILFYLVTGNAPRVLTDSAGGPPHERGELPAELVADPRWVKVRRIFDVAFQQALDRRFRTASDLLARLGDLGSQPSPQAGLADSLARFRSIVQSNQYTGLMKDVSSAKSAMDSLTKRIRSKAVEQGLVISVPGTIVRSDINAAVCTLFLSTHEVEDKLAGVDLQISYDLSRLVASYRIRDTDIRKTYFDSSAADLEALIEAGDLEAEDILRHLVERLASRLEERAQFPAVRELGLSKNAVRLGLLLSERSQNALEWDPQISVDDLQVELSIDENACSAAIKEMTHQGFVQQSLSNSVGARKPVFCFFDKYVKDWNPKLDALTIARIILESKGQSSSWSCESMGKHLGWDPRRLNPAVMYLVIKGALTPDTNATSIWTMHWLHPGSSLHKFVHLEGNMS
ncbi:MAG: protein kinase [Betaproteobacteria bacterium]|nr:protein kinase [Betaproteobacteria bacterium]